MRHLLFLLVIISFTSYLVSCSKSNPDKFIGKWKKVQPNNPSFKPSVLWQDLYIITKNGNNTTYVKEGDKLQVNDGGATVDIIFDANTKHLLAGGNEFERTKDFVTANGTSFTEE